MCQFTRVAKPKYHETEKFNNRHLLSYSSGGSESKVKVSVGPCSLWGCYLASLLAPGSSLAGDSVAPIFTWRSLRVPVCAKISPFYRDTSHRDSPYFHVTSS